MSDKTIKSEHISMRVPPSIAACIRAEAESKGLKVSSLSCEILTNHVQSIKSPIAN